MVREPSERRKNTANERRIAKQYKEGTPVKYNQGGATSRGRRVDGTLETLLSRRRRKTSEEARKCVAEIHATARSFKKRCEISSNRRDISPRLALFHKEAGYFTKRRHVSRAGKGIAISKRHVWAPTDKATGKMPQWLTTRPICRKQVQNMTQHLACDAIRSHDCCKTFIQS